MNLFLVNILKGIIIGIANIIPGISGATLAFILGIYKKSIDVITKFDAKFIQLITNFKFYQAKEHISLNFILAITIGIIISFVVMSHLLEMLLLNYPKYTWSYFFGIILASIPYIGQYISKWTKKESFFFHYWLYSITRIYIYRTLSRKQ